MSVLGLAVLSLFWWSTASSTAAARIALLATVESYAFAVFEQLAFNFAETGEFSQTIHRGYEDSWVWGGHRAPILPLVSTLYGLSPSAWTLSWLQIAAVLSGVVPAAAIGARALRSHWGAGVGGALYLLFPAVLATALQDYQDLIFILPLLPAAWWLMGHRHWAWTVPGTILLLLPREETLLLLPLVAAMALPLGSTGTWLERLGRKQRLLRMAIAGGIAGLYLAVVVALFPIEEHHDTQARFDMLIDGSITLFGALSPDFYQSTAGPTAPMMLLSPASLGWAALVFVHMTVPMGHGIGRHWSDHAHHVAPAIAFAVIGVIEGTGLVLRLLGDPRARQARHARIPLVVLLLGLSAWRMHTWSVERNWIATPLPVSPVDLHPAWDLKGDLTTEDVPVVPMAWSLVASSRPESYTFGESLVDHAPGEGLGAGTHALVHVDQVELMGRVKAMAGASMLREVQGAQLWTWDPDAVEENPPSVRGAAHPPQFWRMSPGPAGFPPPDTTEPFSPDDAPSIQLFTPEG
ncbi:MAG: DUF2079 domain-containing protein [Proteobacteria bacterium]|nr:DUF2079 domain-containing protein [Pseudomonadota bacterium]MCP4915612.1 DUF2079 domain-containing protein [Pseudomonadota bacterium]